MSLPIAIQLYLVEKEIQKDFRGTLEKVKAMGYDGVEFAGLFDHSAEEVKAICDEIGLIPMSAHIGYQEYVDDLEDEIEGHEQQIKLLLGIVPCPVCGEDVAEGDVYCQKCGQPLPVPSSEDL